MEFITMHLVFFPVWEKWRGFFANIAFLHIWHRPWSPRGCMAINFTIQIPLTLEMLLINNRFNWPCSFLEEVKTVKLFTHDGRRTMDDTWRWTKTNCNMTPEWLRWPKNDTMCQLLYLRELGIILDVFCASRPASPKPTSKNSMQCKWITISLFISWWRVTYILQMRESPIIN